MRFSCVVWSPAYLKSGTCPVRYHPVFACFGVTRAPREHPRCSTSTRKKGRKANDTEKKNKKPMGTRSEGNRTRERKVLDKNCDRTDSFQPTNVQLTMFNQPMFNEPTDQCSADFFLSFLLKSNQKRPSQILNLTRWEFSHLLRINRSKRPRNGVDCENDSMQTLLR